MYNGNAAGNCEWRADAGSGAAVREAERMHLLTFTGVIVAALLMGALIGLERQFRGHAAGLRTNALVSVGAALFVSLSLLEADASPTRIAAQVVSGIGFLGGGVILREGFTVRGMNTAATLWCSAAVGVLSGAGFVAHAAIGTVAVLVAHLALRPVVRRVDSWAKNLYEVETVYRVRVTCIERDAATVRMIFTRHVNARPQMNVQGIATEDAAEENKAVVVAEITSAVRDDRYLNDLVSRIGIEPGVTAVSWERVVA